MLLEGGGDIKLFLGDTFHIPQIKNFLRAVRIDLKKAGVLS